MTFKADLEKAARGASGACGHFVGNHAILSQISSPFELGWRKKNEAFRIETEQNMRGTSPWRSNSYVLVKFVHCSFVFILGIPQNFLTFFF